MNKYSQRVQELGGKFLYGQSGRAPVTLSEEELQAIEVTLGHSLIPDYREFLRDFGGYSFGPISYPLERTSIGVSEGYLGAFYGLKIGSTLDLLQRYTDGVESQVIGPELLPIADDAADDQTCLFLAGPLKGSVHFWDLEEAKSPYDYSNLYPVADSFDEFMQLLCESQDK